MRRLYPLSPGAPCRWLPQLWLLWYKHYTSSRRPLPCLFLISPFWHPAHSSASQAGSPREPKCIAAGYIFWKPNAFPKGRLSRHFNDGEQSSSPVCVMDKTQPINEEYKKFDTLEADIEMKRNGHGTERDKKEQKALFNYIFSGYNTHIALVSEYRSHHRLRECKP